MILTSSDRRQSVEKKEDGYEESNHLLVSWRHVLPPDPYLVSRHQKGSLLLDQTLRNDEPKNGY